MQVRMLVSMQGRESRAPGDVVRVPDDEAKRLIAKGFAEEVETASVEAPEQAVAYPRGRGRPRKAR